MDWPETFCQRAIFKLKFVFWHTVIKKVQFGFFIERKLLEDYPIRSIGLSYVEKNFDIFRDIGTYFP